jgi:predicted RNA-binding Zn ribbon-like protein
MATSTFDMPLSGGHPALDFANTVDSRTGRWGPDLLRSYDDIIVLAKRLSLIDQGQALELSALAKEHPRKAAAALKEAVRLREAIYALFLSEDAGDRYPPEALEIVRYKAQRARARQILTFTEDGYTWLRQLTDLNDLVGSFALAATELIIGRGDRRLIRECKGDNCGWLFLDTSKSGQRLWCSDATCGTHERVKRFRTKQKQ